MKMLYLMIVVYLLYSRAKRLICLGTFVAILILYYGSAHFILPHRHLNVVHGGHRELLLVFLIPIGLSLNIPSLYTNLFTKPFTIISTTQWSQRGGQANS